MPDWKDWGRKDHTKPPDKPRDSIDVNVTINSEPNEHIVKVLAEILHSLSKLEQKLMATTAEFQAGFDRLNQATSQIATILSNISANIGNMTKEEEDAARDQLNAAAASLEAMAASATNPVPVPVPVEPGATP